MFKLTFSQYISSKISETEDLSKKQIAQKC